MSIIIIFAHTAPTDGMVSLGSLWWLVERSIVFIMAALMNEWLVIWLSQLNEHHPYARLSKKIKFASFLPHCFSQSAPHYKYPRSLYCGGGSGGETRDSACRRCIVLEGHLPLFSPEFPKPGHKRGRRWSEGSRLCIPVNRIGQLGMECEILRHEP